MSETTNNSWSDEQIKDVVEKAKADGVTSISTTDHISAVKTHRNLMVIGCGDGGCNIASEIRSKVPDVFCIAYNTSKRAMDMLSADIRIIPTKEDGSGKIREYSQDVFKNGAYKHLLQNVTDRLDKEPVDYIIVTTTCDGGTGGGVSPMVAKFISDNVDCPVIIMGVYPALSEDATAQYNAMNWQKDVEKTGLPYIILDNNSTDTQSKVVIHHTVNEYAVKVVEIISGVHFGETNISAIDNRDMYMLLQHVGGRISVYGKPGRPTVSQSIDDYLISMIDTWAILKPEGVKGIGIFIKSSKDVIAKTDTSLSKFRSIYGDAAIQYVHLEECDSSDPGYIALVCTGCDEDLGRIMMMRDRYNDIQANAKKKSSMIGDMIDGMDSPLGSVRKEKRTQRQQPDLSALEF